MGAATHPTYAAATIGTGKSQPAGPLDQLVGLTLILAQALASSWPAVYILTMTSRGGGVWWAVAGQGKG